MEQEARNFIDHYKFIDVSNNSALPFKYYRYDEMNTIELIVAVNGTCKTHAVDQVGTVPAAVNAFALIQQFAPDLVISAGTAGGFKKFDLRIGEVVLSKGLFWYHDRRISLPNFLEYGLGGIESFSTDLFAKNLNLRQVQISSGDSLATSKDDFSILEKTGAKVKEMEATAIAWVCRELKTPFFAVKSITDFLDVPEKVAAQFIQNLNMASENLTKVLIQLIELIKDQKFK